MKTKTEIVENWLPRYTGVPLADFGEYVLLTNFGNYLELFARATGAAICANTASGAGVASTATQRAGSASTRA